MFVIFNRNQLLRYDEASLEYRLTVFFLYSCLSDKNVKRIFDLGTSLENCTIAKLGRASSIILITLFKYCVISRFVETTK